MEEKPFSSCLDLWARSLFYCDQLALIYLAWSTMWLLNFAEHLLVIENM